MSDGTHVLIDESCLSAGRLTQNGVRNMEAINDLSSRQTVKYDFGFHSLSFQVDAPVLILSHAKSLLKVIGRISTNLPPDLCR